MAGGQHAPSWEWPLSGEDKKRRVFQLYELEVQAQLRCDSCSTLLGSHCHSCCRQDGHASDIAMCPVLENCVKQRRMSGCTPEEERAQGSGLECPSTAAETPEQHWDHEKLQNIIDSDIFMTSPPDTTGREPGSEALRIHPGAAALDASDLTSPQGSVTSARSAGGTVLLFGYSPPIPPQRKSSDEDGDDDDADFSVANEAFQECRSCSAEEKSRPSLTTVNSREPIEAEPIDEEAAWRHSVNSLDPEMFDADGKDELVELHRMWGDATDPLCPCGPSCRLLPYGDRPILVTAPHSIAVLRDEGRPHLCEPHTASIGEAIARSLNGTILRWSEHQQRSSEILWNLSSQLAARESSTEVLLEKSLLDPRIRDPNFLAESELCTNPWYQQMRETSDKWKLNDLQATLHIDVHGCQDPPATPAHLTIGLGAMMQVAGGHAHIFGETLQAELPHVVSRLVPIKNHDNAQLLRVIYSEVNKAEDEDDAHISFSGAWLPESGRHTQTQQAICFAGFTHSLQLELSTVLRKKLHEDPRAVSVLSNALRSAWVKAQSSSPRAPPEPGPPPLATPSAQPESAVAPAQAAPATQMEVLGAAPEAPSRVLFGEVTPARPSEMLGEVELMGEADISSPMELFGEVPKPSPEVAPEAPSRVLFGEVTPGTPRELLGEVELMGEANITSPMELFGEVPKPSPEVALEAPAGVLFGEVTPGTPRELLGEVELMGEVDSTPPMELFGEVPKPSLGAAPGPPPDNLSTSDDCEVTDPDKRSPTDSMFTGDDREVPDPDTRSPTDSLFTGDDHEVANPDTRSPTDSLFTGDDREVANPDKRSPTDSLFTGDDCVVVDSDKRSPTDSLFTGDDSLVTASDELAQPHTERSGESYDFM